MYLIKWCFYHKCFSSVCEEGSLKCKIGYVTLSFAIENSKDLDKKTLKELIKENTYNIYESKE